MMTANKRRRALVPGTAAKALTKGAGLAGRRVFPPLVGVHLAQAL